MRGLWVCLGAAAVVACSSSNDDTKSVTSANNSEAAPPGSTTPSSSGGTPGDTGTTSSSSSSSSSSGGTTGPVTVTTNETMTVMGETRHYILVKPASIVAGKAYPLVMSLHGNPGTAAEQQSKSQFELATGADAVVVYPDGDGGNWDLTTPIAQNADFAFIQALAANINAKVKIDTSRVFGNGHSGGAFFLNQFTCRVGGVFKAFASESGGAPYAMNDESTASGCFSCPAGPIPSIHIHGDQDNVVGPGSGPYAAKCWSFTDNCSANEPTSWSAVTPSPCVRAPGCSAPLELCDIAGMGHDVWSQHATASWAFFQSLP